MDAPEFILHTLESNKGIVKMALEGLTDDDLVMRPDDRSNPVGWLVWHQTRTEDRIISGISGGSQVWMDEKWHEKFGKGDRIRVITTGGGGWGNPLGREVERVRLDVIQGKVTREGARKDYGVVVGDPAKPPRLI